jgi:hypothetical protein
MSHAIRYGSAQYLFGDSPAQAPLLGRSLLVDDRLNVSKERGANRRHQSRPLRNSSGSRTIASRKVKAKRPDKTP